MTTYFTADTHFGHAAIIGHCARPFSSVEVMDRAMVERWNEVVKPRDTVWVVGDFAAGPKATDYRLARIFGALNGSKHLIRGNHDKSEVEALPWGSIRDMGVVTVAGTPVFCCHYPMRTWPMAAHGSLHVFGHCHGDLRDTNRSVDVGVDRRDFRPVTLDEIKARMAVSLPSADYPDAT